MNTFINQILNANNQDYGNDHLLEKAVKIYMDKFYSNASYFKFYLPFTNTKLRKKYDKTIAYSFYTIIGNLSEDQQHDYFSMVETIFNSRELNNNNLFNNILFINILNSKNITSINQKFINSYSVNSSPTYHVELYRLAICFKLDINVTNNQINKFMEKLNLINIKDLQEHNAFQNNEAATEHEFAYLCLGLLELLHLTNRLDCKIVLEKIFEELHTLFIRKKTLVLNKNYITTNSGLALMSVFFLSFYLLLGDSRALNIACYLLEKLDTILSNRNILGDSSSKKNFRLYNKCPSWLLAYYIVARKLKIIALEQFKESL